MKGFMSLSEALLYIVPCELLDGDPVIRAKANVEGAYAFFACPWCGKEHSHGLVTGWRVSHCDVFGRHRDYYLLIEGFP